eukprot:CAMPEP_0195592824 /NCGR_PEP_ID=MMETSP0815-20121206/558_1 /TAXON_ID=97485 /ORGANISM="Prymnesium parvum, Strain Texoma1" /LENGTH=112 /DNA_ID=CAMNT_0040731925 /DNA_START=712 /DNA_END=1047 /DNA_ORIENTATION=-
MAFPAALDGLDEDVQMDGELTGDGAEHIGREDGGWRVRREARERLGEGDEEEESGVEEARQRGLRVAEAHALKVQHGERVGGDEAVEREDLEHLHRGDERAPPLRDDVEAPR